MNCPYCQADTGHANNHVRMSSGDGHGPQGSYPDDWNRDAGARVEQDDDAGTVEQDDDGDRGDDHDAEPEVETESGESDVQIDPDAGTVEQDDGDGLADLTFGDDETEASEYECGNCSAPLEYLGGADAEEGGKECPECGERLFWSQL